MVVTVLKSSLFSLAKPCGPPPVLEKRSLFLIHPSTILNIITWDGGKGEKCLPLICTKVPYKPCVCTGLRMWLVLPLSSKDDVGPKAIEALILILNI